MVIEPYPSAALSPFYPWMVLAWSAADAARYLYFATRLVGGHQYQNLTWLRYSAFYVLYPIGIASEVGVVYNAISESFGLGYDGHAWAYIAAATLYIPGRSWDLVHRREELAVYHPDLIARVADKEQLPRRSTAICEDSGERYWHPGRNEALMPSEMLSRYTFR